MVIGPPVIKKVTPTNLLIKDTYHYKKIPLFKVAVCLISSNVVLFCLKLQEIPSNSLKVCPVGNVPPVGKCASNPILPIK